MPIGSQEERPANCEPFSPYSLKKVFLTNKLLDSDCRLRIELLFNYHGDQYKIGETESHEDATENEYDSDTKTDIWLVPIFSYLVTTSRFISDFQRFDTTD